MLEIAKIRVDGIFADVVERSPITANLTGGCIRVEYAPGIWDGLTKTIVFKGSTTKDVVTNEAVIEIPPETVAAPSRYLQVGFFGVDAQRKLIIPTLWANLGYLQPGADPSGDTSTDQSLPVWAQLADQIKRLEDSGVVVDPEEIKKIVDEYLAENPPSGGNVDLTGYATEEWVEKGYQPKGNYLTKVPDGYAKTEDIPKKPEDIGALPSTYTPPNQTAEQVGADPTGTAANAVTQHNVKEDAHADIRLELKRVADRLAAFLDSDDEKLDQLSELIAGISSNKTLIEAVTTGKVSVTDIIDNLTTNVANKPLSAAQGVALKGLIDNVSKSLSNYQPKGDYALRSEIPAVPVQSVNGKTGAVRLSAADVGARPSDWVPTAADVGALPNTYTPPNQTAEQVGADAKGTAASAVSQHNTAYDSHNDIRLELKAINDRLTAFFDSDNQTLDELSEIVAYITSNKSLIDSITTSKVSVTDIINNLTTNVATKPLSAAQGVVLKGLIDAVSNNLANYQPKGDYALRTELPTVPTNISAFNNDAGYLTQHQDISGLLPRSELPGVVEDALAEAKQSGVFDGPPGDPGYTPVAGVDYYTDAEKAEFSEYIASELAKRGQLAPEYAASIEECTDTTKMYVLPDGFIYAYMLTEVETETGGYTNVLPSAIKGSDQGTYWIEGAGYSTTTRLSGSGGNAVDGSVACASGFIKCKVGDVIRIKNFYAPQSVSTYVISYNGSKQRISSQTFTPRNSDTLAWTDGTFYTVEGEKTLKGVTTFTLTEALFGSDIEFIRFSGNIDGSTIVTINEEIKEKSTTTTTGYAWASTGHAFVPADYEDRIIDLEALTETHSKEIASLKKGVANATDITEWDAPIYDANIPVFQLSAEKAAMTNAAQTPADIYTKYDALMAKHPQYITKTDLGLCSDGINHVYRYDFREPDSRHTSGYRWSETKTKAIIVSGIHYEWSGIYGLYYALEEIADNPELYSFRRNSHLIVVPCMNPYATIESNYNNSKGVKNANGVEIHRNFEVGWILSDSGDLHYGGAKPLSEVETQYVDTIMRENADAALFLTCHSFADTSFNFIWPSTATPYMCNMGYRLIDKLSNVWMEKHGSALVGLEDYRTEDIPSWDNRLGFAHISMTPGTETRQGTTYGIQSANVEINGRFWVHGTKASPEPSMSAFTMSRGAEVYVNFLMTVFGTYDPKDKKEYAATTV